MFNREILQAHNLRTTAIEGPHPDGGTNQEVQVASGAVRMDILPEIVGRSWDRCKYRASQVNLPRVLPPAVTQTYKDPTKGPGMDPTKCNDEWPRWNRPSPGISSAKGHPPWRTEQSSKDTNFKSREQSNGESTYEPWSSC